MKCPLYWMVLLVGLGSAAQAQTTLEYWTTSNEQTGPYYQALVEGFNSSQSETKVVLKTYANEAYKTALQVGLASQNPPDIFFNWAGDDTNRFAREGQLLPLTTAASQDGWGETLSKGAVDAFNYDDELYGTPTSQESKYFFYNKRLFDENSLTPPTSFSELLDLCRTLRSSGITPMSLGNSERWQGVHYLSIFNQKIVGENQTGKDYALETPAAALFTDPGYTEAFQKLVDMQDAGCFADAPNATSPEIAWAEFYTEQVAMTYGGTWTIGTFNENGFAGQYGFFRMPPIEGGKGDQNFVLAGPIGLEVSARTSNPKAAEQFIAYAVDADNQRAFYEDAGRIPVDPTVVSAEGGAQELYDVVQDLATADGTVLWLDTVLQANIAETYLNVIQEVLNKSKTPAEAAAAVRQAAVAAQEASSN